jgi:hypothetical protein
MTLKKFYYYLYYNFYCFFINISDDYLNSIKPVVIITALEAALLIDAFVWYNILFKNKDDVVWPYFLIGIFLSLFNNRFFLHNNKYKNYFKEFKNYSKRIKIIGGWITFLIVILIIVSVIFSFYQMSLINWKKYT